MNSFVICLVLLSIGLGWSLPCSERSSPGCKYVLVNTPDTTYHGDYVTFDNVTYVYTFKGIKYAEAPSGERRFRAPEPFTPTELVTDARKFGRKCPPSIKMPFAYHDSGAPYDEEGDIEDCLNLNVYIPENATGSEGRKYSVMVFIHGGAFLGGSSSEPSYEASALVAVGDVIVVTVNYRLGALGMLYGGSEEAPGNVALRDQVAALKWVAANIEYFGGDPKEVTLFGESAGSISVGAHVLSPLSKGLFRGAILQSGAPNYDFMLRPKDSNLNFTRDAATKLKCLKEGAAVDKAAIDCLRKLPVKDVQEVNSHLNQITLNYGDDVIPERPANALRDGHFNAGLNLIFGVVNDEGSIFYSQEGLLNLTLFNPDYPAKELTVAKTKTYIHKILDYSQTDSHVIELAQEFYTQGLKDGDGDGLRSAVMTALGDVILTCPTVLFGDHYAKNSKGLQNNVYSYRLMYQTKSSFFICRGWMGICHGADIAFVFGTPFKKPEVFTKEDVDLSIQMMKTWSEFAKKGKVEKFRGTNWDQAIGRRDDRNATVSYLEIGQKDARIVSNDKYRDNCYGLWANVLE